MKTRTSQIKNSFSKAEHYDSYAVIQPMAADILAETLPSRINPKNVKNILELGAGTGALTLKAASLFPHAQYICTDLSEKMLERARNKTKHLEQKIVFAPLNMENLSDDLSTNPHLPEKFDLIISNLAFQWIDDRIKVLEQIHHCLHEGGSAFLTTLLQSSLQEWRHACKETANPCSVPQYPSTEQLETEYPEAKWTKYQIKEEVKDAFSFLKGLKEIGAIPKNLFPHEKKSRKLKSAMAFFNQNYNEVTYEIGLGEIYP